MYLFMIIFTCYFCGILFFWKVIPVWFYELFIWYQTCFATHMLTNSALYWHSFFLPVSYTTNYDNFNQLFCYHFYLWKKKLKWDFILILVSYQTCLRKIKLSTNNTFASQLHIVLHPIMIILTYYCCDFGAWFCACLGPCTDQRELVVRYVFGCVYRPMGARGSVRVWVLRGSREGRERK